MRVNNAVLGAVLVGIAAFWLISALSFPETPGQAFGAGDFPRLIALGLGACGVLLVITGVAELRRGAAWGVRPAWLADRARAGDTALVVGTVVFYVLAAPHLGFVPTVFVCLFVLCRRFGGSVLGALAYAASLAVVLHLVFVVGLKVALPLGLTGLLLYP